MFRNEDFKRSLNAFVIDMHKGFNKTFIVMFIILACFTVIYSFGSILIKMFWDEVILTSSSGVLNISFMTVLITLSISFFISATKSEINSQFFWPINRKVYAIGNFIVMLFWVVVFISSTSLLLILEWISVFVLKYLSNNTLIVINSITFENFIVGFWVSLTYIMLAVSIAYCLGMFFFRNKLLTIIVLSVFSMIAQPVYTLFSEFFTKESSVILFSIKAWLAVILIHWLAYVPLRRMEVDK